jgi:hypothetical protein
MYWVGHWYVSGAVFRWGVGQVRRAKVNSERTILFLKIISDQHVKCDYIYI